MRQRGPARGRRPEHSRRRGLGEWGGVHFREGKVGKEELWVGGCWRLLIKCKFKADGMQTDMSNFCVCSLGGVWRETSILGERLLDNLLSTHRKDLQMSHLVNSVGMRRHDRGGDPGPQKEKRGHPGEDGPGCRGKGGGEAGGRLRAKGAAEGMLGLGRKGPGKHWDPRTNHLGAPGHKGCSPPPEGKFPEGYPCFPHLTGGSLSIGLSLPLQDGGS